MIISNILEPLRGEGARTEGRAYAATSLFRIAEIRGAQDRMERRPAEELYELKNDHHQLENLVENPKKQERVRKFRSNIESFMKKPMIPGWRIGSITCRGLIP